MYPKPIIFLATIYYKQALKRGINSQGCDTLDLAAKNVRVNNRGLLCIRFANECKEWSIGAKALSYYLDRGKFPDQFDNFGRKLVLFPLCRNRGCVNQHHLILTPYEGKTMFEGLNTIIYDSRNKQKFRSTRGATRYGKVVYTTVSTVSVTYPNPSFGDHPGIDLSVDMNDPNVITIDV